jgi:hypothetical protein
MGIRKGQNSLRAKTSEQRLLPRKPQFSFPRFTAIQGIECEENLPGLAPEACFIAAKTIEREAGKIGKT